ncbi:unnamed protein product [Closterium sp. NIES-54]
MEIARTSRIHARAPHFLWPYAVCYTAYQLNLWPRVSRPGASPTSLWTRSLGVASEFRVWGCLALVRDTSVDKLLARALPCIFLGFLVGSFNYTFYHSLLHRFLDSRDVIFDEPVSYYTRYPCRGLPVLPPPIFLAPSSPPAPAPPLHPPPLVLPHQSPQQPLALPRQVAVDSEGVGVGGMGTSGASSEGAGAEGAGAGGASSEGAGAEGASTGGASSRGARAEGAGTSGASSRGAYSRGTSSGGAGSGGASYEKTGAGGAATAAPTPPPHRYPTSHQRLHQLEREERAHLEQERLLLQQQQQQQSPPLQPLCPPSSPPVVTHNWTIHCLARARPSSPFDDLYTVLLRSSPRCSPPLSILLSPPESSLTASTSTPIIDYYRATRPVVIRVLASLVTDPRASLPSISALTAAVTDFAATRRFDYATRVVLARPLSAGGESALGCDVIEDRQFELEFLAAASPHMYAMMLCPEGDPAALDIPTPRTYHEAVSRKRAS